MAVAGRRAARPHRAVGSFRRGARPEWVRGDGLGPQRRVRQERLRRWRDHLEPIARVRGVLAGDLLAPDARLLHRAR